MLLGAKLTSTRFSSWCNVFDDNVVVLDGKLTTTRFLSWCIVIDDNLVVLDGNYIMKANILDFTHCAMI